MTERATTGEQSAGSPHRWKCPACGDWLRWNPGKGALTCQSCGREVPVERSRDVTSHPFRPDALPPIRLGQEVTVECPGCGAKEPVVPPVISGRCSYCKAPFVATSATGADPTPDAIVQTAFDFDSAEAAVHKWFTSRRLAPRTFKTGAARPQVTLAYQPYWAFDTDTLTSYEGERGEHYMETVTETVTDENGTRTVPRQEPRIRWHPAGGTVRRAFRNVGATAGGIVLPEAVWDFSTAERYADDYLSGASAVAATIPVAEGWNHAMETMASVIEQDVRAHIGGDSQKLADVHTAYRGAQFRYLLAPSWSGSYHWNGKDYSIAINAETGGVSGERPWSRPKIGLSLGTVVAAVALIVLLVVLLASSH